MHNWFEASEISTNYANGSSEAYVELFDRPVSTLEQVKTYARAAEVSWTAVENAESYIVELMTQGLQKSIDIVRENETKFTELSPSKEYTVKVTATARDLKSNPAVKLFHTRPSPPR